MQDSSASSFVHQSISPAPLKNGAGVRGSRLKIAADMAGVLGSSEAPAKTGRSFSLEIFFMK